MYTHTQGELWAAPDLFPFPHSPPLPFQVMLLKNFDQANKLVNGSRGVVVGFEPPPSHERMRRVAMHPPAASPLIPRVSFQVDE